jgi:putative ATP-dependent endonuclease of OLD family
VNWGKEVLRLAEKTGKGWFAVLLSEHLTSTTAVPDYILEAIAFACQSTIDRQCIRQMAKYRCEHAHSTSTKRTKVMALAQQGTIDDLCIEYAKHYPDDVLNQFINLLA